MHFASRLSRWDSNSVRLQRRHAKDTAVRHGGRGAREAICSANTAEYHRRDSALWVAPRRNERVASGQRPKRLKFLTENDFDRK